MSAAAGSRQPAPTKIIQMASCCKVPFRQRWLFRCRAPAYHTVMSQHQMAIGFLILLAIAPAVCFLVWSRRTPFDPFRAFWYLMSILLVRVLWRAKIPPMPIPPGQGAVLVSNHRSSVDPFFIEFGSNRHVHWMGLASISRIRPLVGFSNVQKRFRSVDAESIRPPPKWRFGWCPKVNSWACFPKEGST